MIVLQSISSLKRYKVSVDDTGAIITTETSDSLSPTIILEDTDCYQLQVAEDGALITTLVPDTTPTPDEELMLYSPSSRRFLLSVEDTGPFVTLITTPQAPVIVSQNRVPRVYVGNYLSIALNGLLVSTAKMYPGQFTIDVSANSNDYTVISTADDGSSVKIQILGDPTVAKTITASTRVYDGSDWSAAFLYQIDVILGRVKKSKPTGYNVSGISRS
jgi:hypothetical protein